MPYLECSEYILVLHAILGSILLELGELQQQIVVKLQTAFRKTCIAQLNSLRLRFFLMCSRDAVPGNLITLPQSYNDMHHGNSGKVVKIKNQVITHTMSAIVAVT